MSDFDQPPHVPAPPVEAAPSPFGAPPAPAPPPAYNAPGYPVFGAAVSKPPRPSVAVGAVLLVLGGVMLIGGSFLSWFSVVGETYTGFSSGEGGTKDGPVFSFLGAVVLAFGITQLLARKVLAVGILSIVFAALALLAALADITDVSKAIDRADSLGVEASSGPGLWVILIGSMIAMAGGIATVAKRRR